MLHRDTYKQDRIGTRKFAVVRDLLYRGINVSYCVHVLCVLFVLICNIAVQAVHLSVAGFCGWVPIAVRFANCGVRCFDWAAREQQGGSDPVPVVRFVSSGSNFVYPPPLLEKPISLRCLMEKAYGALKSATA